MSDEPKKDWRKEMDEQEAKHRRQEAEYEKKMKSIHRCEIALNCVSIAATVFLTLFICLGAFQLGRSVDAWAGRKPEKACIVEPATVETTGAPRIVPDDIFGAYAVSTGAEVTGIVGDRGLPTPPR